MSTQQDLFDGVTADEALRREKRREYNRRWNAANPEKQREYYRRWNAANPEKDREKKRLRYASDPKAAYVKKQLRLARIAQTTGTFTTEQFKALCAHFNDCCLCCGERRKLTPDHVIPLAWVDRLEYRDVALNDIDNIQPLCRLCNAIKYTKHIDYRTNPHRNCIETPIGVAA
jgi:hypothetical protein